MLSPYTTAWAVIADDLTGACDTGVQFVERGLSCAVWLDADSPPEHQASVIAVTTNSRQDPPDEAHRKAELACRVALEHGATHIYKKIDSTLHGNLVVEMEAVMTACGAPFALVSPAFPEMGRTVVGGSLHVAGSEASVDVVARLREQGAEHAVSISPDHLEDLTVPRGSLAVVDAQNRDDLARIARAGLRMQPAPLLAGSAALAREVAAQLGQPAPQPSPNMACAAPGPVLLCIGSTNPVTLEQMALVASSRVAVVASPGALPGLLGDSGVRGLVLSGGDTALLACRTLGARGIHLQGEIVLGIPWGRLIGGCAHGLPVATKAGGFGGKDALVHIVDFLSRQQERVNER